LNAIGGCGAAIIEMKVIFIVGINCKYLFWSSEEVVLFLKIKNK